MHKKIMLACMAIAAFAAFVIAPAASAATLTESGVAVPVGASITGVNSGASIFNASGLTVECTKDHISGTVKKNGSGTVEGEVPAGSASFKGTETGEDCKGSLGPTAVDVNTKLCLKTETSDKGAITGCGSAVTFTLTVTGGPTCRYASSSIPGTHSTSPSDASISLSAAPVSGSGEGNSFLCPASGTITMTFVLTTTSGTTLTFS